MQLKEILPVTLVAFGSLLALWLNPTVPPLLGSRCSLSVLAMLVIANRDSAGEDLGFLPYLIFADWFRLVQVLLNSPRTAYLACPYHPHLNAVLTTLTIF